MDRLTPCTGHVATGVPNVDINRAVLRKRFAVRSLPVFRVFIGTETVRLCGQSRAGICCTIDGQGDILIRPVGRIAGHAGIGRRCGIVCIGHDRIRPIAGRGVLLRCKSPPVIGSVRFLIADEHQASVRISAVFPCGHSAFHVELIPVFRCGGVTAVSVDTFRLLRFGTVIGRLVAPLDRRLQPDRVDDIRSQVRAGRSSGGLAAPVISRVDRAAGRNTVRWHEEREDAPIAICG